MIDKYEVAARAEAMPNIMGFIAITAAIAAVCGVAVFLQKHLSKQKCKWHGLILPALTFFASLFMVGRTVIFSAPVTMQATNFYEMLSENAWGLFALSIVLLVITNIPTVILLFIYRSEKFRMNIWKRQ
ncbi:MAG: hypothetical protein FWF79_10170 [Defluviitaleaceae bacterium]|nr:hypothetical protein [Defluviitaleaceae bacterium]